MDGVDGIAGSQASSPDSDGSACRIRNAGSARRPLRCRHRAWRAWDSSSSTGRRRRSSWATSAARSSGSCSAALAVFVAPRSPVDRHRGHSCSSGRSCSTPPSRSCGGRRRENLLSAHRSHLYQRLVLTGVSHRAVALLYGALATVGVAVGIAVVREVRVASIAGALLIGALAAGLWLVVSSRASARSGCLRPRPEHVMDEAADGHHDQRQHHQQDEIQADRPHRQGPLRPQGEGAGH